MRDLMRKRHIPRNVKPTLRTGELLRESVVSGRNFAAIGVFSQWKESLGTV